MTKIFSSLRFRLILLVLLATLPAFLLIIYNGQEQRQQIETEALENVLQLTAFAAAKNELIIEDTRVTLIALSHAMNFEGDDLGGCGHLFNHLKEVHFPFYSAFYVADLAGHILCSMPDGDIPEDLLGCHHYLDLIASDDFVVSEYHICRNSGKGVISMGYPVWAEDDQKLGVINVGIDLMWFNDFAMDAELPPDATLTVFDRDGVILAHYPDPDFWVGKIMPEGDIQAQVFHEIEGTARGTDIDQIERLYAFQPLTGSEDSVFIVLSVPTSYAFADVEQTTHRNLILIGLVALLALLAAWLLGGAFVGRQVDHLVDTTQRLANGDLAARTRGGYAQGEFGVLNKAIDEMAQALSDREKERRQAEAEIREYAANLELTNRDLMDFANITSHDLQEPLRKISTFSDLLLIRHAGCMDDEGQDYLKRIRSAARRMQNLIIDLLAYSRISTTSQPVDLVDLNLILRQVLNDLEVQIERSNAQINAGDLAQIHADPVQMQQLFLNLLGNSLKFRKPDIPVVIDIVGEPKTNLNLRNGDADYYQIAISDNGIGFDQKYSERIFQPFERLHPRTQYEGTGMGLAICRKIVERHYGEIIVQSKEAEGTTFTISLPIYPPEGNHL